LVWRDANVPGPQLRWFQQDLATRGIGILPMPHGLEAHATIRGRRTLDPAAAPPTIVFIHQLLDGTGDYYVNNAPDVRAILEASGRVLAVFQGHHHKGGHSHINSIHYCMLSAMVEGPYPVHNAFAIVEVAADLDIHLMGYRDTPSREMART